MSMLTFAGYYSIVTEDAAADDAALNAQIAQMQTKINNAVKPLQDQLNRLQTMLVQKQKQAQAEMKTQNVKQQQGLAQQQAQQTQQMHSAQQQSAAGEQPSGGQQLNAPQ